MVKTGNFLDHMIKWIFVVFIFGMLISALLGTYLRVFGWPGIVISLVLILAVTYFFHTGIAKKWISKLNFKTRYVLLTLLILFVLQISVYHGLLAFPNWDPGFILQNAQQPNSYLFFSWFPNLVSLLTIAHWIFSVFPGGHMLY